MDRIDGRVSDQTTLGVCLAASDVNSAQSINHKTGTPLRERATFNNRPADFNVGPL
jgi:hypothetical protein